jgi:hypothetical protein
MPSTSSLITEGTSGTQNQGRFIKKNFLNLILIVIILQGITRELSPDFGCEKVSRNGQKFCISGDILNIRLKFVSHST